MALPPALSSLLDPWLFMSLALSYLPGTLLSAILALDLTTLLSPSRLRAAWFGRFWARAGPDVRTNAEKNVVPLLQGHVSHGIVPSTNQSPSATPRHPPISGTLLELGPGSGMWTPLFSPPSQAQHNLGPITKIYGIEPNTSIHPLLRQQIAAANLSDTYEIVPVGIEDLSRSGAVAPESIDCIVTIMCLCSIPSPRENMAALYGYLKPGGRWYVYEHVKCFPSQGKGMGLYQAFLDCLWPHVIGGCEMGRDTGKWLREAGPWSNIDLCPLADEPWYYTMPHVIGVLTK